MATSFQFALSPVLQLRERAVEAAQEALGRTVRARAEAEDEAAHAESLFLSRLTADAVASRTAHQIGGAASHRDRLARALNDARRSVDRLRGDEARARRALADAMRQREALTVLRTEAADAHRARALRVEVAALDDLASAGRAGRALAAAAHS